MCSVKSCQNYFMLQPVILFKYNAPKGYVLNAVKLMKLKSFKLLL